MVLDLQIKLNHKLTSPVTVFSDLLAQLIDVAYILGLLVIAILLLETVDYI